MSRIRESLRDPEDAHLDAEKKTSIAECYPDVEIDIRGILQALLVVHVKVETQVCNRFQALLF